MKKLSAVTLCLLLTIGCAFAGVNTRTGMIQLEGVKEEFVESLYQSAEGYELWYPADDLIPGEKYGHPCFVPVGADEESDIYFMIVPAEAKAEDAALLLGEAVGGFGPDAEIEEIELTETAKGNLLGRVNAVENNTVYRYYLISDQDNILLVTASFPLEAAEGFGVRFDRMARTVSFDSLKPDTLYEGDGYAIGYFAQQLELTNFGDHALFVPASENDESGVSLIVVKSDISPEHADGLLAEAVGGYVGEYTVTNGLEYTLPGGLTINWIQAEQDGTVNRFYLIKGDSAVYCLTATFPFEDESDYGAMFDAMAESFEMPETE